MKLSVPTNLQKNYLESIDRANIAEIYGKLESDAVGGGRASMLIPSISRRFFKKHVSRVHDYGIKFNYLLNAPSLNNIEVTAAGQRKIRRLLDWLSDIDVDIITVSIPYLLEIIKSEYPHFEVSVSLFAKVDSPIRAKFWENLGADQITLSFMDVNRDFQVLDRIRSEVTCRIQLIANLLCLYRCPFSIYHAATIGHASQKGNRNRGFLLDYSSIACGYIKMREPWRLISSCWIRPEDMKYYENIGIDQIKLVDRIMNTQTLKRIIQAYTDQQYPGNLLDLLPSDAGKYLAFSAKQKWKTYWSLCHPFKANIFRLYGRKRALPDGGMAIDNSRLNGFLDYFIQGKCQACDCENCGYCERIGKQVITFENGYLDKKAAVSKALLDDLITGKAFYQKKSRFRKKPQ